MKTFYTEKEAADMLGIAPATLRRWRCRPTSNSLPFTKVGRSVRYMSSEIKKWVERNTQK